MKISVLGSGLTGLVGSKVVSLLQDRYQFDNLDLSDPARPIDITDERAVRGVIAQSEARFFLHCAAFTDVTGAWEQTGNRDGLAYRVNVVGTEQVARACLEHGVHLIHLSTAYVFDGSKRAPYLETDQPKPLEWYGQTKLWAEEAIARVAPRATILRIDQPFRSDPHPKPDLLQRIKRQLEAGTLPPQFRDHWFGPTYIDDLALVIDWVMKTQTEGLFHASSGESWTDYDFARQVAQALGQAEAVQPGYLTEYLKTSQRPYQVNTVLSTKKLEQAMKASLFKRTPIKTAIRQALA